MKKSSSQLEHFLQDQRTDGQSAGGGHFTLARDEAVRKLAEFQLPFPGAWMVKVVQSLVASGLRSPIMVGQSRRVTTVRCAGNLPWSLADLDAALVNPDPHESRAVNHMVMALRVVGMSQKRSFEICLAGDNEALLWDGARLHNVPREMAQETLLTVTHESPVTSTAWLHDQVQATRRNSEVATALREYCFTCPLPLCLDKRRIDGLQHGPEQGWSNRQFPLTLTFLSGDLPQLEWPPGTFEAPCSVNVLADGGGLQGYSKALFSRRERPPQSELAVLLTAHVKPHSERPPGTRAMEVTVWKFEPAPSQSHWIQDGVRIRVDPLSHPLSGISVALFLSAEGLATDLSGFSLRDSDELRQRQQTACALAQGPIGALRKLSKSPLLSHNKRRYVLASNTIVAASLGLGWFLSSAGIGLLAVPIGCIGFIVRFAGRHDQKNLLAELGKSAVELDKSWMSFRGGRPPAPSRTDSNPSHAEVAEARQSKNGT